MLSLIETKTVTHTLEAGSSYIEKTKYTDSECFAEIQNI